MKLNSPQVKLAYVQGKQKLEKLYERVCTLFMQEQILTCGEVNFIFLSYKSLWRSSSK